MQQELAAENSVVPGLLRGIRDDIVNFFLPSLSSGDEKEHAEFARLVLDRHATELEIKDGLAKTFGAEFAALIEEIELALAGGKSVPAAAECNLDHLRTQLAAKIRDLSSFGNSGAEQASTSSRLLSRILSLEARLQQTINSAQQKNAYRPPSKSADAKGCMTVDNLSAYLRRQFSGLPDNPVLNLTILPGGRSKTTIFVTLKPNTELPDEVVIRQDIPGGPVDNTSGTTSVRNEYPVLRALAEKDLPIARPLLLEAKESECGHPFMMVERLQGKAPGTFFGFFNPQDPDTQSAARDMARVMGRLHSVDVTQLGLPDDLTQAPEERLRLEVEYRWNKWRDYTVEPSPIIECALARLHAECKPGLGGPVLVHGDIAPHNVLARDGRITALLDWEFVHAGDPAQDLAYCRATIEQVIPWAEFMAIYLESGGKPVDERRLAIFGLVGLVRNCTFSATGARFYLKQQTQDFTTGAIGYFSIPYLEAQIIKLLNSMAPT